jgi:hypothetical protein
VPGPWCGATGTTHLRSSRWTPQALVEHLGIEVRANDKQLHRSGRVERFIEVRKKGS